MPTHSDAPDGNPNPLALDSVANQFKCYLMALEHLVMELPEIIAAMEDEDGSDAPAVVRLKSNLARIREHNRAR